MSFFEDNTPPISHISHISRIYYPSLSPPLPYYIPLKKIGGRYIAEER
jgi:hypothetical protein